MIGLILAGGEDPLQKLKIRECLVLSGEALKGHRTCVTLVSGVFFPLPPPPRRNVTSHSDVTLLPSLSSSFPVGCIFFLSSKLLKCCYFSSFSLPMGHAVAFALFLSWLCPHLVHPSSKPGCCLRSKPDLRHPHGPLVMWPDAVHIH